MLESLLDSGSKSKLIQEEIDPIRLLHSLSAVNARLKNASL